MNLIELKDLSFTYPAAKRATLRIPQLSVKAGEKIFLFGPSGSGKTTLLEILAGVLVPQSGEVRLLDKDIVKLSSGARDAFRAAHLGYVFQSFNLIPYLNVAENISLPLHLSSDRRKKILKDEEEIEIRKLCQELGIEDLLNQSVGELSVGQQQRVAVARALLGNPELILADEPTSALDADHRERFIKLLFEVCDKHKTTVIFVSHDRGLEKFFDRSIALTDVNQAGRA